MFLELELSVATSSPFVLNYFAGHSSFPPVPQTFYRGKYIFTKKNPNAGYRGSKKVKNVKTQGIVVQKK
jgi:hypothetical protein